MKTTNENIAKKTYFSPQVVRIQLDNEISLVLASDADPGVEPDWSKVNENNNNDPFKTNIG